MSTQGKSLGVMQVEYAQADHWFTDKELAILTNIASQAAVGVENMRLRQEAVERARLERELQLAHDVQTSLLPSSSPDVPGWQIASYWQAAHTVGGDFYDFVPVGRDQLGVVIADVSDKGMSAALFMALARSILRASITRGGSAARTLERANKLICADAHDGMFVTLFYAIIGATAGVVYANAGHTPPLLVNEHGAAVLEEGHGIALGVVSSASLAEKRLMVGVDDVLVFYTDGLTEAIDDRQEQFGLERLIQVVQNNRQRTAAGIIDEIVRALGFFAGSQPPFDDLTIIVAKRV
jgi:serine phosphatase RsbU (regulator of sigma subunit)